MSRKPWAAPILTSVEAPTSLVDEQGKVIFGHFDGPVTTLGQKDFHYKTCMDSDASKWAKHFHYKQFQFVSIVTPHYIIGVALADIRYLGSAFCYLYDIKRGKLLESNWLKPLGLGYQTSASPFNGVAAISGRKGHFKMEIVDGVWHLTLQSLAIDAELSLQPAALSLPMAMCSPTGYNGWTYTQKHNGLKVLGRLFINDEPQPLQRVCAGYDFSAGYMRSETSWRWASINALTSTGSIGLNLAAGVNETGTTENVFWHDGERHLLGPVRFQFTRQPGGQSSGIWRVFSDNGQVNLRFSSVDSRFEKLNLWLLKSNFRQYIGYFDGYVIDNFGQKHEIINTLGLTEDHFAKW
ncbi:DUF2804 domain-containing protein [Shewanella waksmanii]|uniref:DUF2804 domain-containing protein n=1 Tax=Shewanella waksmanii TaxID=213783 RepID=UPI00373556BD